VQLADLPTVWRGYLHDEMDAFADLVPPGHGEVRRLDWTRVLARLRRSIETPYRMAEILALVEQGPTAEDLARAPRLSPWMPALALGGAPVVAGFVQDHPKLGETWMRSSLLMGLGLGSAEDGGAGLWARTWSRWYRLGERMTGNDLSALWQAGVNVELLSREDAALEAHFADLRLRLRQLFASLAPLAQEDRSPHPRAQQVDLDVDPGMTPDPEEPKPMPESEPEEAPPAGSTPEQQAAGPAELASLEARHWRENLRLRAQFLDAVPALSLDEPQQAWLCERRLFAVEADGRHLVPAFQLDASGQPRPVVGEILARLPAEWTSWQIAFWFVSGNGWLGGDSPCERLGDREAVLNAAEQAANPAVG
jgi:hypothetical protein